MSAALNHRADIDGLRSVAILPILLFHAGVSTLAGGFVGVDIFFVISGFLITSIIVREVECGQFRLIDFYRRRAVRIFPALIAMIALVLAFGAWRLLPSEFERLAASAMASLAFASNIHFWLVADYFSPDAELMPLLHTWSLGVEEQFYIVFPLAMMVIARFARRHLLPILALATALSFAGGWILGVGSPVAAFYLLPVRAWELLAGSLVAVWSLDAALRPAGPRREIAAIVGAGLMVAAIVLVRDGPGFPVPQALLPVAGTALLLACGEGTAVGRVLSLGPLRYIGRISYSTYLWHWPLIAFWRTETGIALDAVETVALIVVSLGAGALSYHAVEKPLMDRYRQRGSSGRIVAVCAAALAVGVGAIAVLSATGPAWRKLDPQVARIAAFDDYLARDEYQYQFRRGPCFRGEAQADIAFDSAACVAPSDTARNVVVVGDSYAAQYWRAFALRLPDANVMQATASGCRPVAGGEGDVRCREVVDHVLGPLLASGKLDTVVLAGRWLPEDLALLPETIRRIRAAGARTMVIGPVPEYEGSFATILARATARGDLSMIDRWRKEDRAALDRKLAALVEEAGGTYLSPLGVMCPRGRCVLTVAGGDPVQFDYGHLTLAGSRWVVDQFELPGARAPRP